MSIPAMTNPATPALSPFTLREAALAVAFAIRVHTARGLPHMVTELALRREDVRLAVQTYGTEEVAALMPVALAEAYVRLCRAHDDRERPGYVAKVGALHAVRAWRQKAFHTIRRDKAGPFEPEVYWAILWLGDARAAKVYSE